MYYISKTDYQPERDLPITARIINNVAMNRMIDSRKDINKTNKLIIGNWKNALTAMKTVSIF
jgi:hypothetical protein